MIWLALHNSRIGVWIHNHSPWRAHDYECSYQSPSLCNTIQITGPCLLDIWYHVCCAGWKICSNVARFMIFLRYGLVPILCNEIDFVAYTLLAKKVVTPPLKTIKPMWIELLCFHLAEIGMIWTRDCSPTKSDTTLGRHSMQGQVGSSSSETTV